MIKYMQGCIVTIICWYVPCVHAVLPHMVAGAVALYSYYDYKREEHRLWNMLSTSQLRMHERNDIYSKKTAAATLLTSSAKESVEGGTAEEPGEGYAEDDKRIDNIKNILHQQHYDRALEGGLPVFTTEYQKVLFSLQATPCWRRSLMISALSSGAFYLSHGTARRCLPMLVAERLPAAALWQACAASLGGLVVGAWLAKQYISPIYITDDNKKEYFYSLERIFPRCSRKMVAWSTASTLLCWAWRHDIAAFAALPTLHVSKLIIYPSV